MANALSQAGLEALTEREGMRLSVYADSGGAPTIGVGHLLTRAERASGKILIDGVPVKYASGITIDQCHALLAQDAADAVDAVRRLVRVTLEQHQFDALVSLVFNIGVAAFDASTLLRKLNGLDFDGAANEFGRWKWDNGHVVPGLVKRRESERKQFTGDV